MANKSELKVDISNFTYNPLDKCPIKFHCSKLPSYDYNDLEVEVTTVSDLGGYWYLDDCQGTVWTIKLPREIFDLVKAEGSSFRRTTCGHWTVDYNNFHLLANPDYLDEIEAAKNEWQDYLQDNYPGPDPDDQFDGWNVSKILRSKIRKLFK